MLPAPGLAAMEGLVLCHSKQDRPDGTSRIVFGPADAIAELQASGHQLGTLIEQQEPLWAEVPNILWSLNGRTFLLRPQSDRPRRRADRRRRRGDEAVAQENRRL